MTNFHAPIWKLVLDYIFILWQIKLSVYNFVFLGLCKYFRLERTGCEKQSKNLKDLVEAPDTPTWKIKNYVVEETG